MSKLKPSKAKTARHDLYKAKGKALSNKKLKVLRHLKSHPNDSQAETALKSGLSAIRTKPTARLGWVKEELKAYLHPTTPSRGLARQAAQAISFSLKVAKAPLTKAQQAVLPKPLKTVYGIK